MIPTYQDAVDHLLDYLGSDPGEAALRDAKKSVLEAYRDLANAHSWTYLYTVAVLQTGASAGADPDTGESDGSTVTYLHSSGQFPRQVTLSGATWPSWAADGVLVLGRSDPSSGAVADSANLVYRVDRLVSSSLLTLQELSNPGSDIPAPSAYSIYRDQYPLPLDFMAQDATFIPGHFGGLDFIHPREWHRVTENEVRVGRPRFYSVAGSGRHPGRFVVHFSPLADAPYDIHYAYKRRPRPLSTYAESAGFMTIDADLTSIIASGGASFGPQDVGAVVRFSSGRDSPPTDEARANPAYHEAMIADVFDQTHASIDTPSPTTLDAVKYVISDVLDIDPGSMHTALLRLAERKLSTIRIMKDRQFPMEEYLRALDAAKCADSRSMMARSPREYLFGRQADVSLWRNR